MTVVETTGVRMTGMRTTGVRMTGVQTAALTELGRDLEVELPALLCGALFALLHLYTHEDDLSVDHLSPEALTGEATDPWILPCDLSDRPSFLTVVERLGLGRGNARTPGDPPADALFAFGVEPSADLESGADADSGAKVRLVLHHEDSVIHGWIEHRGSPFPSTGARRLGDHFVRLLAAVLAEPRRAIAAHSFLSAAERHLILHEWNDTARDFPQDQTLPELFEEQARRTPEAPAAIFGDDALSYAELEHRSNRLAHHLITLGVGPETPVVIYMERGLEIMVALVAILKAGGAYAALDLSTPKERVAELLAALAVDSRPPVVLTLERLLDRLPEAPGPLLCLDRDNGSCADRDSTPPQRRTRLDNLHSVVFTSGSTGQPKGVLGTVGNYLNLLLWYAEDCAFSEQTRSILATGLNWDASFRSIFGALLRGGATVLADNGPYDAARILATMERHRVSVITCPPSLMNMVIDLARRDDYRSLASMRHYLPGGERLMSSRLRRWIASPACQCRVVNVYGPAETADLAATGEATRAELENSETVSIGRPLANQRVFLLGPEGRPRPLGVPGEICVAGAGPTRGFLGQPALTAEKYVPNPFAGRGVNQAGERLYHTGDLGRWRRDGRLEFLGRVDHQIKLRGQRVELGEIETRLGQHPGVRTAVVSLARLGEDDQRLVAYVLPDENRAPSRKELREFLAARLPAYMVPNAFMTVEEFPLNASGKIDRKRLPEPVFGGATEDANDAPPSYSSPREEEIAGFFAELLCIERIGPDENFFDYGGHSLLVLQLLARLNEAYALDFPLPFLLEGPTVAEVAEKVEVLLAARES